MYLETGASAAEGRDDNAALWAVYIEYETSFGHLKASKTNAESGQSYL